MADPNGFLKYTHRELPKRRPVPLRLRDWNEVYEEFDGETLRHQATRCMDCGIPFCHNGCPLGNLIPEWNDLVRSGRWRDAIERLHATNNFPDFTGRLCPAPCEPSCVLGINQDPVTIKQIEVEIIDNAFDEGWVMPLPPDKLTGKTVAVVGSGPAGLAAAQQLTRAGHSVTVFERADRIGGLLRYGIPEFKMEKRVLDRRLEQMSAEGTEFRAGVERRRRHHRRAVAGRFRRGGAGRRGHRLARPARSPAASWTASTRRWSTCHGVTGRHAGVADDVLDEDGQPPITAKGKKVIIIGGGDTGADCLGTAHRQGAASIHQFEIMPRPPDARAESTPWPTYPLMYPGGVGARRRWRAGVLGQHRGVRRRRRARRPRSRCTRWRCRTASSSRWRAPISSSRPIWCCWRWDSSGPEKPGLLTDLGVSSPTAATSPAGRISTLRSRVFSLPGTWVAGQSLIVWAIAEGRAAAAGVDRYLMGSTALPAPVKPTAAPLH